MARLLPDLKEYHRPETLEKAYQLLCRTEIASRILAGATSLAFARPPAEAIVDITRIPLSGSAHDSGGDLLIGATTTIHALERDSEACYYGHGIIRKACDNLASTPLRNLITTGGNVMGGYVWSDLPVAFLALDARMQLYSGQFDQRTFDTQGKFDRLNPAVRKEILTHVVLPAGRRGYHASFRKFARTQVDLAFVSAAASFASRNGTLQNVRVVCGALIPEPQRILPVERLLEGARFSRALCAEAGKLALESISPRQDNRAGADYRRSLLGTLVEQVLLDAWEGRGA
jgi:CO/xanthine dehydrogenase FAD-binding subunit